MGMLEEITQIFKSPIERSSKDISDNYQIKGGFKRNKYLKGLQPTSSKRVDTFILDDNYIEGLQFDQRIDLYKKMYLSSGWVQRGIDAIVADCLNTFPLVDIVFDEDRMNKDVDYGKKILNLKSLMENPSNEMGKRQLFRLTYMELLAYGNSFWQKIWNKSKNEILSFVKLRPETMRIIPKLDKITGMTQYFYLQELGEDEKGILQYKVFNQDDVIHFKVDNIVNPLYGKSKLDGLMYTVYMDLQAQKYQSKFFKYGVSPGCIINIDDTGMNEDELDYINDVVKQKYNNMKEPHSPMILMGKSMKIVNDKDTLSDLGLRDLREADIHEILNILGIPPLLLSIGKLQIQRQDTAVDNYVKQTVAPLQNCFCDTINEQLIKRHYDEPSIILTTGSQIVPGTNDAADFVKTVMQVVPMTFNEVRERVGLTLLEEGGSEFLIYTPNGVVPLNYHFNFEDDQDDPERKYTLDAKGRAIDPKKMVSTINLKLGQKIKREQFKLSSCNNRTSSLNFNKQIIKLGEIQRERDNTNEKDYYQNSLDNLKLQTNKIGNSRSRKVCV